MEIEKNSSLQSWSRYRGDLKPKKKTLEESYVLSMMARREQTKDRECRKEEDSSMDLISMLPDEILGLLVSQLNMKEAIATSILCRRWRGLWRLTSRFDFDGVDSLVKLHLAKPPPQYYWNWSSKIWLDHRRRALDVQRLKYVKWVNNSLARLTKDLAIQCFKVSFNLTKSYQRSIDGWVRYALSREVQTLKLKFTHMANCSGLRKDEEYYVLPFRLLLSMHLKTISLYFVNVNGEALVLLLHNCPHLQDLSVCHSPRLSTLRVIGPFPSFKRFKIRFCPNLKSVVIRDVDLVCFKYAGKRIQCLLHKTPLLLHISAELDNLLQFSSILLRLEMLNLCLRSRLDLQDSIKLCEAVIMNSLKQLVVTYSVTLVESLLPLTYLIRATPCLEKFVLKSRFYIGEFCERKMEKCENLYSHVNLKEVEFVGYRGTANELELVMYFVKNAVALQKILIDTRIYFESRYSQKLYDASKSAGIGIEETVSRLRVKKQLANVVPADIDLQIL